MEPSSQVSFPKAVEPTPSAKASRRSRRSADDVDRWCERGILGLVLLALVFGPLAFGAVDVPQILVLQAITVGVVAIWAVRCWLNSSYRLLWPPVCWAVLAFLGYAVIRWRMVIAEGGIEYVARQELILVGIYGLLFFAVVNNLSRQECAQVISVTLFGVATLISVYAVYQFLTKSGHVLWIAQYPGYIGRGSGTYICPNHLAGFLEMILPLALAFTLTGRSKPTVKVFFGYAALAVFAGIGVTLSRGGWVAAGAALLVFFGLLMKKRGQRLAGIIFILLLVAGSAFFVKNLGALQRRKDVTYNENKDQNTRLELWQPAIQIWKSHPWWGAGPGHFDPAFRAYRPDDIQMRPLYAHNDYLNTLADWGIVGLGLIAAVVGLLYFGVIRSWKFVQRASDLGAKRSNRSAFVLGAAVSIVAMLVHSVVDFNMHIPANALVAIVLMALLTGHFRFATERFWFKLGWLGKLALTAICLASAAVLAQQGMVRTKEYVLLERAGRTDNPGVRLQHLKAAYAVEPRNAETIYAIGETLRLVSWQSPKNYRQLAEEAMEWFDRGMKLDRYDPNCFLGYGMCLDWLDRHDEAERFYRKALELDPKSYFVLGHLGWHYFQSGRYAEAKEWFEKAVFMAHWLPDPADKQYPTGRFYLRIIEQQLKTKGETVL